MTNTTATEGLTSSLTVEGTVIALLSEVTLNMTRDSKEWVPMGSLATTDVLLGAVKYQVTAKHGYVDNTYANYITGGSILAGTIIPCTGGGTFAGSLICTASTLSGMVQEAVDPVFEDLTFTFFEVTHT
jgi:hypothetical protein